MFLRKTLAWKKAFVGALFTCFVSPCFADVSLPRILSDGIVLQRHQPIHIWGWATKEKAVTVKLADQAAVKAKVDGGKWLAVLPPQKAGGPFQIKVTGENEVVIKDVLIGELWVASGQSNMELPMYRVKERYPEEFKLTQFPQIRQFKVPKEFDFQKPRDDLSGGEWMTPTPENLGQFAAVPYFFAKELQANVKVPVGVLVSAYGGATAQGWMSKEALRAYPHYYQRAEQLSDAQYLAKIRAEDKILVDSWYRKLNESDRGLKGAVKWFDPQYDFSGWSEYQVPGYWEDAGLKDVDGVVWFQKTFELPVSAKGQAGWLKLGRLVDADVAYVNGVKVGEITYQYPPRRYDVPAELLHAGTNTLTVRIVNNGGKGGFVPDKPYELIIGEHTIDLSGRWQYKLGAQTEPTPSTQFSQFLSPLGFFNAMLSPILNVQMKGVIWYQGESNISTSKEYYELFPAMIRDWRKHWKQGDFPFIFVQLANLNAASEQPAESSMAEAREAQRLALSEPNTGMAVATDLGEWNDIHPLDKASVAHRLVLNARHLAYGDKKVVYSGPQPHRVSTKKNKLIVVFDHVGKGLKVKGETLSGFAIAGKDKHFYWAKAKIKRNKVILTSNQVSKPMFVRYAWADNPAEANLYNREGLPAVPFEAQAGK